MIAIIIQQISQFLHYSIHNIHPIELGQLYAFILCVMMSRGGSIHQDQTLEVSKSNCADCFLYTIYTTPPSLSFYLTPFPPSLIEYNARVGQETERQGPSFRTCLGIQRRHTESIIGFLFSPTLYINLLKLSSIIMSMYTFIPYYRNILLLILLSLFLLLLLILYS